MALKTYLISFRSSIHGGASIQEGRGYQCEGLDANSVTLCDFAVMAQHADERRFLFAVHGFNVPGESGWVSASRLHDDLRQPTAPFPLSDNDVFIGILWPGDGKIPFVNYPWEAFDAVRCGQLLADVINRHFARALSVSFASHSLGARVVLSAAEHVAGTVDQVIVTAPAADNDCLARQHARAIEKARQVYVLSSKRDRSLRFAYPAGDFLSDVFGDDDNPLGAALGYRGPRPATMDRLWHTPIAGKPRNPSSSNPSATSDYDHCHYFPSPERPRPGARKSDTVSRFISAAFAGQQRWP